MHWKKNDYAVPKNLQFGEWELVKDTSMPALTLTLTLTPNLPQKAAMLDAKASESKTIVEKKKHSQVINVLKESIDTTTITKRILN